MSAVYFFCSASGREKNIPQKSILGKKYSGQKYTDGKKVYRNPLKGVSERGNKKYTTKTKIYRIKLKGVSEWHCNLFPEKKYTTPLSP